MDPRAETLRRTAAAAARFRVPEAMIAAPAATLTRIPEAGRRQIEVDALVDAVLRIADAHGHANRHVKRVKPSARGSP